MGRGYSSPCSTWVSWSTSSAPSSSPGQHQSTSGPGWCPAPPTSSWTRCATGASSATPAASPPSTSAQSGPSSRRGSGPWTGGAGSDLHLGLEEEENVNFQNKIYYRRNCLYRVYIR